MRNRNKTSFPRRGLSIEARSRRKNTYSRAKKAFPPVSAVTLPAAPGFRREKQGYRIYGVRQLAAAFCSVSRLSAAVHKSRTLLWTAVSFIERPAQPDKSGSKLPHSIKGAHFCGHSLRGAAGWDYASGSTRHWFGVTTKMQVFPAAPELNRQAPSRA